MTRHGFDGGYALFSPFEQCEDSVTSIEFISKRSVGLIFYNGPVSQPGRDDPTDYIALWLQDGYPVLSVSMHGLLSEKQKFGVLTCDYVLAFQPKHILWMIKRTNSMLLFECIDIPLKFY